ncbi:RNA demethylase ALKBH9B-like protein [Drosera capensis]
MSDPRRPPDPFLDAYSLSELRIASEFLTTWLPFLTRGLCDRCSDSLSRRVKSIPTGENESICETKYEAESVSMTTNGDGCDTHSAGSWKDETETNSVGSWKDELNGWSDTSYVERGEASSSKVNGNDAPVSGRMSWADMAQEDELVAEEEREGTSTSDNGTASDMGVVSKERKLSRDEREYYRFVRVKRKKDFICLERIDRKLVNILDGLELHSGVFSAAEQRRIVDFIYELQESGQKGELRERTYTAPRKWMRGKGRQTIQFGCCYNYATDKDGNPPGILKTEDVDPLPPLFKVIIKRLIRWHVLPASCVPDSCIVNIYEEGDCIPPHIDNHDFVRPFCTISFLSECNIVFGTDLKAVGPGEFSGPISIPLPVGTVLVLNGNGADVAKHCVPAVPTKRISITFRRMDVSKRPLHYTVERDLQGLQPLKYGVDVPEKSKFPQKTSQTRTRRVHTSGVITVREPRSARSQ